MPKIYRTAMGRQIDIDQITLSNENVIAVGNCKVNARGDELGPGGKIVKTRDQIMREYYALNTPIAADPIVADKAPVAAPIQPQSTARPAQEMIRPVAPAAKPVVEEKIEHNPISGLDEIDDGPIAPVITQPKIEEVIAAAPPPPVKQTVPPVIQPVPAPIDQTNKIRGSLASSVAKGATVTQQVAVNPNKPKGVQRF